MVPVAAVRSKVKVRKRAIEEALIESRIGVLTHSYFTHQPLAPLVEQVLATEGLRPAQQEAQASLLFPPYGQETNPWLEQISPEPDQIIAGLHDAWRLGGRASLWDGLKQAYGEDAAAQIMPPTHVITRAQDWMALFQRYPADQPLILKHVGKHKRSGLRIVPLSEAIRVSNEEELHLAQPILPSMLFNGHKMSIRAYLLLEGRGGRLQAWLSSKANCFYAPKAFDADELDPDANITQFEPAPRDDIPYLIDELAVFPGAPDRDRLFSAMQTSCEQITQVVKPHLLTRPHERINQCFVLFGLDYLLTPEGRLVLIEVNRGPGMATRSDREQRFKFSVWQDVIRHVFDASLPDDTWRPLSV